MLALVVLLNLWPISLTAQEEPANSVPYKLHVNANLLQVPTLVSLKDKQLCVPS